MMNFGDAIIAEAELWMKNFIILIISGARVKQNAKK
jgi:hypothetical protein